MKKTRIVVSLFLTLLLIGSNVFSFSPVVRAEEDQVTKIYNFESDFESDELNEHPLDMDVNQAGGSVKVVDVLVEDTETTKAVFLDDQSDSTNVVLSKSFDDLVEEISVSMSFMQPKYTSSTKIMRLKGDGTPIILETKNNAITYRTGDHYERLIDLEENKWYEIHVDLHLDSDSADVYINGELKLEAAQLNQNATKINFFETFTPNSGMDGHYVDNIKIIGATERTEEPSLPETNPEPIEPEVPETDGNNGIYEAEYAKLDKAIIDNKHTGYTGDGFVDYQPNAPGGWIEWLIHVPVEGEYRLDFRYAHGGTDHRPAEVMINDHVIEEELPFDPTGGFADWEYSSIKAELKSGENKVKLTAVGPSGGANIDHLKVLLEVDQIYEAEDAAFDENGVIIDNKHVGFTGTGFIDYAPNAPGSWVDWLIDIPVKGDYYLDFRYANGGTDKRPAEIKINDEVVIPSLAFDPSGGWATWVNTTAKVTLDAGQYKIRATGIGPSGGANIDHLRVHNLPEAVEEGPIEIDEGEIDAVVGGLLAKKLKEIGMLSEAPQEDQLVSRMDFMALVNQTFGFTKTEKYKNLSTQLAVWEVPLTEWDSYILETAKEAGYMESFLEKNKVDLEKNVTKKEAEQIIAQINKSQVVSNDQQELTWKEARKLLQPYSLTEMSEHVHIASVQAVSTSVMAIVLDSYMESFDFSDLEVVIPTRQWELLSPGFKQLRIDKAAQGINRYGQTVLFLHSQDEWNEYGEIVQDLEVSKFSGDLQNAINEADNLLTWQMEHGGWTKNWPHIYTRPWDGKEIRSEWVNNGVELGTIDNDATISELIFLAQIYQETKDPRYKESIEQGLEFLFKLQYPTGGFAQVYPARGNYSDYVTFNDEAMINVLELMDLIAENKYPFDSDLISDQYKSKIKASIELAIDYILNAQIEVDGKLLAWSAQHDPVTYEARGARAYEHPSLSGSESIGIIRYLMSKPLTEEINQAVTGALNWLDEVKLENTRYVSGDPNNQYFVEDPNSTAWYRFYEIGTNKPIFSGRDGIIKHEIMEIEEERRNGYAWGGHWGNQLLEIAKTIGNYNNKVFVQVVNTKSVDSHDRSLQQGEIKQLKGKVKDIEQIENFIKVALDGSGDYSTVQAAIDAVPDNNTEPVTIFIKKGTYKEVITVPNNKPFITLIGENRDETILTYDNYAGKDNGVGGTIGTSGSASAFLRASDFRVENITFENSFDEGLDVDGRQAVAVYASGDRMFFKNVKFLGKQDTLYTHSGTQYYENVYVEGDVDFIFGAARAVFNRSTLHSLDRGSDTNNGYVTAASTLLDDDYGMMIMDSVFTSDAAPGTVYLGRPWPAGGNPQARGSVLIKNSELGEHIHLDGWTSMSGLHPSEARLFEYKNTGPGAIINDSRRQLTDKEAEQWTIQNVLNGWDPTKGEDLEEPLPTDPPENEENNDPDQDPDQDPDSDQDEGQDQGSEEDEEQTEDPKQDDNQPQDQNNDLEQDDEKNQVPEQAKDQDQNIPPHSNNNKTDSSKTNKLPSTATGQYNLMLMGAILILVGVMSVAVRLRKR